MLLDDKRKSFWKDLDVGVGLRRWRDEKGENGEMRRSQDKEIGR